MKKELMAEGNLLKSDEDIVRFLYVNVYKQRQKEFYFNLSLRAIENLIAANFQGPSIGHDEGVFVVNLIKKQPFILKVAFEKKGFDFDRVFGFLEREVTMTKLRALEETFIPFCKNYPEKMLDLLMQNAKIKDLLLSHFYLKNIFKMIYTTVFCLQEKEAKRQMPISKEILEHVAKSVFTFSPQKFQDLRMGNCLDVTEVAENFRDFLYQLMQNLTTVYLPLLIDLISILDEDYLQEILSLFETYRKDPCYREYCESLIQILINLVRIYQFLKINLNRESSLDEMKMLDVVQRKLSMNAIYLAQKMPRLTDILLEKPSSVLSYSSGETIPMVGMIRYRLLELIEKLLSVNDLCDLEIDFKAFDFFPVIEFYIQFHKWNNIIHNLVLKITELILSHDYSEFQRRYASKESRYSQTIFGNLIANFRNKKFIFLHSLKMTNNGNRCHIYQLTKMLVNEMKQRSDLSILIANFKLWKEFMEHDLQEFERTNYRQVKLPDNDSGNKNRKPSFDMARSSSMEVKENSRRTLETFDEILDQIKEGERWNPAEMNLSPAKRISDQKTFVRRFDSIGYLEDTVQQ